MKLVSWNVNGLRACLGKGFVESVGGLDADAVCIQETKMQPEQAEVPLPGYEQHWYSAEKKGYSGTATFSRLPVRGVTRGVGVDEHDHEGRVLTVELDPCYLVNVYAPNAQDGLARIGYRMRFEDALRTYIGELDAHKPVILCGDLNVAHNEIDLKNPGPNRGSAGFSDQERGKFGELLGAGLVDSFRRLYPDLEGAYSWWSYRMRARERNAGWRIDYFLVSARIAEAITAAAIHSEIMGSDHCPVSLEINL